MPVSITATLMPAPLVTFHACSTPSRSSSHCHWPGASSPQNGPSASWNGSGVNSACGFETWSSQMPLTLDTARICLPNPAAFGTTVTRSSLDRSVTISPPASLTAWRIAAGDVPCANLTTWIPRLLPRGSLFAAAVAGTAAPAIAATAASPRALRPRLDAMEDSPCERGRRTSQAAVFGRRVATACEAVGMLPDLEPPIRAMLDATNRGDSDAFLAAFADDAVLVDWGREFRGREQIAGWDRNENIGVQSRIEPTSVERSGDAVKVGVDVRGNGYNGGGAFTFRLAGDRIVRMEISG